MKYRMAEILAAEDLGVSGTKTIEINVKDPISRLVLRHEPVGGSNTPIAHPVANITKLELVDGSDVLYSMTGHEGQALNIFDNPDFGIQYLDQRTGGTPLVYLNIDFGRHLWDPELAFLPDKFKNPQLKLQWNEAAYDASCSSHSFQLFAMCFDEAKPAPMGFLTSKEIKSYTPVSGGHEYTDMPTDRPIRKLIIKGLKSRQGVRALIETIKLSEDNDKRVIIDGDIWNLRSMLDSLVPDAIDVLYANAPLTGQAYWVTPSDLVTVSAVGDTAARVIIANPPVGGNCSLQSETGTSGVIAHFRGKNPHGCICLPFGKQEDLDDWYDLMDVGSLVLRIKGGGGSASGDIIGIAIQQLRAY